VAELIVAHLVPAPFDPGDGVVGGAERYAFELARHMSARVTTRLVTFGATARTERIGRLEILVLDRACYVRGQRTNPIALALLKALRGASIIHCHQQHVLASSVAAAFARLTGRRVFVTDLGGGGFDVSTFVSTDRWYHGHLHISEYSRKIAGHTAAATARVISGGVDTLRFSPNGHSVQPSEHRNTVLFVGRILPHKGVHDLIDAVAPDVPLRIVGQPLDQAYLESLRAKAAGKHVTFVHDADDEALIEEYRRAACVVLPSVYTTPGGDTTRVPELLGQTLLEAMACGRPVICTDVASMPEVVIHGENGFVVPPNNPQSLGESIDAIVADPVRAEAFGRAGRQRVLDRFRWEQVVDRCLDAYAAA
jgi:glycosyltransferase involved in cell wall biosynthesis